jgi:hypothetical protein
VDQGNNYELPSKQIILSLLHYHSNSNTMEDYSENRGSRNRNAANQAGGAVYGLGLIGAAIFFIGHAASFWAGVLGFLKAIIWPVILVYKLLEHMQ